MIMTHIKRIDEMDNRLATKYHNSRDIAFANKIISLVKEVLKHEHISPERLDKLHTAILDNVDVAKKISTAKFPAVGPVNEYMPHQTESSTIELNSDDKLICETTKTYNTTSRYAGFRGQTSYEYRIYLQDSYTRSGKSIGNSYYSKASITSSDPNAAKNECRMEALIKYFKI